MTACPSNKHHLQLDQKLLWATSLFYLDMNTLNDTKTDGVIPHVERIRRIANIPDATTGTLTLKGNKTQINSR